MDVWAAQLRRDMFPSKQFARTEQGRLKFPPSLPKEFPLTFMQSFSRVSYLSAVLQLLKNLLALHPH